ncbi:GroEL-like apical domain-containing protein [Boletus reticuloceps]|uniref:GroEL-like apical domain-containing protein n=1 Tax=Boletus reticuloceps TaxID=495285 RepID=A0A8I2YGI1_9AGAM|nr:GroEL-like apical domain-containing protein [Boletus reticuloceps]
MEKVGKEGVITIKEGRMIEDEIEIIEGMCFDRGFISPYFITDVRAQKVKFEKPFILLSEKKILVLQDILPSLEAAAQSRRPLVIIAKDVDGEALAACILNKLHGQLQVVVIKAPGFGDNCKSILSDLAILTGGTVFTDELDIKLEKATPDLLGSTGSIIITEDTIVLDRDGSRMPSRRVVNRFTPFSLISRRATKLSGGVAVIKIGGSSEVKVGEKKDRYDDALNATCAAIEEGILPGGGVALLKASLALVTNTPGSTNPPSKPDAKIVPAANFDQDLGVNITRRRALMHPARTILSNADESSVIVSTLLGQYGSAGQFAMTRARVGLGHDGVLLCYWRL